MRHTNAIYDVAKHFEQGELEKLYALYFHFKSEKSL